MLLASGQRRAASYFDAVDPLSRRAVSRGVEVLASMTTQPDVSTAFLPASYAVLLLDSVRSWGIAANDLLVPFGIDENEVSAPNAQLSLDTVRSMVRRARELTQEPGLGILIDLNTRPNSSGYLSFAAMSASSLGLPPG